MNLTKITGQIAAALLLGLCVGAGQSASAYTPGACRQDAEKLCPGMGEKEAIPCLKTHEAEVSMACKVNLAEARQAVREIKDACQPDMEKFCAKVEPGQGRIRRCLKAHEAELTTACKEQITAARKKYKTEPAAANEKPATPEPAPK